MGVCRLRQTERGNRRQSEGEQTEKSKESAREVERETERGNYG